MFVDRLAREKNVKLREKHVSKDYVTVCFIDLYLLDPL